VVTVGAGCADEWGVTILGTDGVVSVEDRTAECLTAIARTYEEGLAHLAFLARLWEAPAVRPVPALPTMTRLAVEVEEPAVTPVVAPAAEPAAVPAAPVLLAEEPAMLPMTPVAVAAPVDAEPAVAVPADAPVEVSPDAPTAVELPVVLAAVEEPVTELIDVPEPATELIDTPEQDDEQVHVLFAEAATAEIPVQAAA
jgi:hypothetical protein